MLSEVRSMPLRYIAALLTVMAGIVILTPDTGAQGRDRYVTVNGIEIHYLEWGSPSSQPLILLHGIGRVAHTFDHIAPVFADDYRVLAVDMRGHGDSGWDPGGAYLVEDYVTDITALAETLELDDIVLWGNSTGGRVTQVCAALNPERVAALIVEDVGPERPATIAGSLEARIRREEEGWASEDELLAQVRASSPRTRDEVLRAYVEFGSTLRDDGRIGWKRDPAINNGFVPTDLWRFIREIEAPTIYILGGRSTIVPPETQEELREVLAGVEIVTMPGLGHYPSEENPEEFAEIVREFLGRQ
jgi:pimeloyl-ACP methyl ester carboxylesterase